MVEVKKAEIALTDWGKTEKVCPYCAEKIPVEKRECPFCRASFSDIRQISKEDVLPKTEDPAVVECRTRAKWLLAFSILGCTSPIALLVGGIWYRNNKETIARAGASTRATVLVSLGICALYLVMVGLGWLVFSVIHQPS
jgi:hypothetical protein